MPSGWPDRVFNGHLLAENEEANGQSSFSNLLFSGSQRGLLSVYIDLKKGKLKEAISRMRGYYAVAQERAEWARILDRYRSEIGRSGNPLNQKVLPRFSSLANTWRKAQSLPRQLQSALWETEQFSVLADLAGSSGQIVLQAHALCEGGAPREASERLKQIPTEMWNGEAYYVYARCLQSLGSVHKAVELLEQAVAAIGVGRQTVELLAELYHEIGQDLKAGELVEESGWYPKAVPRKARSLN